MQATRSERASLEDLLTVPYINILSYPRVSLREAKTRVAELGRLGVEELVFEGKTQVGRLHLLGIGSVGVVVKAIMNGTEHALKIRRTDANRESMDEEFRLTTLANRVGVGPAAFKHSKNCILFQLVEGVELDEWLRSLRGRGTASRTREMIHKVLNQCRKLDILGLDHGQLSNLRKHVLIAEDLPWILDFESARTGRKMRNVTSAAQYLLIGGKVSPLVRRLLSIRDTSRIISILQDYKDSLSDYTYAKLLESLGIRAG